LTAFAAVLGQIFYFRPQTVYVSQLFLQVITFFMGRAWSAVLPNASRGKFWAFLNPCPFTLKEHVAIVIMSATAASSAEAISVFAADERECISQPLEPPATDLRPVAWPASAFFLGARYRLALASPGCIILVSDTDSLLRPQSTTTSLPTTASPSSPSSPRSCSATVSPA
jgi:hypothetical protein